jgi:hypothetical protein
MSQTHASFAPSDRTERRGFGEQENNSTFLDFRKDNAEAVLGAMESRETQRRAALMKIADGVDELPGGEAEPLGIIGVCNWSWPTRAPALGGAATRMASMSFAHSSPQAATSGRKSREKTP